MDDVGTTSKGAKTATGNDWVAEELAKARKEFKEASIKSKGRQSDETLKAGAKVKALRDGLIYKSKKEIEDQKTKMQASLDKKKASLGTTRKAYKEIDNLLKYSDKDMGLEVVNTNSPYHKFYQQFKTETKGKGSIRSAWTGSVTDEFKDWLKEKRKEQGERLIAAKEDVRKYRGYVYECEYALEYLNKHGTPTKGKSNTATLEGNSNSGSSGSGGAGSKTNKAKEEVLQTDENGNKLIRITDANGNQSFVVEDKDKNRKSIKDDEIKKTSVKTEDIQEAIQKGDWKTLLALFLKAMGERDQQAQLNNGQSNAPVQQTGSKEYRTEDGDVFTVTKDGENIISISMQENGKTPFSLTADELKKYGVDPKDVEKMLENNQFDDAGKKLLDVGYKTEKIIHSPEIKVNENNDIILKDHHTFTGERKEPLVLNEQYLVEKCGMKKGKAEKAMENLRELAKSGNMKQSAAMIVAQYFSKESPAPKLPDVQATYGSPKLNRNPGGKIISVTVKDATGKEKELGYKDFAKAFNCSPEEAKKLRKECVRAIQNGKDVNGVLSFVAENSEGKSKFWTKTATKIGTYVVGAAAVGVGVYAATGGFKKKDNEAEQNDVATPNTVTSVMSEVTDTDTGTSTSSENDSGSTKSGNDTRTGKQGNPITPFIKGGNTR